MYLVIRQGNHVPENVEVARTRFLMEADSEMRRLQRVSGLKHVVAFVTGKVPMPSTSRRI